MILFNFGLGQRKLLTKNGCADANSVPIPTKIILQKLVLKFMSQSYFYISVIIYFVLLLNILV